MTTPALSSTFLPLGTVEGLLLAPACPKKPELPSWPSAAPEAGVSMATAEGGKAGCCKQGRPEESPPTRGSCSSIPVHRCAPGGSLPNFRVLGLCSLCLSQDHPPPPIPHCSLRNVLRLSCRQSQPGILTASTVKSFLSKSPSDSFDKWLTPHARSWDYRGEHKGLSHRHPHLWVGSLPSGTYLKT